MGKKKQPFKPNREAPAYAHFERLLKWDKKMQWEAKQPIKRLTLKDGTYYEARTVKDAIMRNLYKQGNYKYR
jgi:hypothetical protein|tara:strand:+ start:1133 stop:1348 length:216 start_codon:yes stop_codon:yes gene_type:complete